MKQMEIAQLMREFVENAKVKEALPFGNGHINDTYLVKLENAKAYLLQRINHNVFKDVQGMMNNIQKVTQHIASKGKPSLHFYQTLEGKDFHKTAAGEYWRLMRFEPNTKSFETTSSHQIAEDTGRAVADFQIDISDLNPKELLLLIFKLISRI